VASLYFGRHYEVEKLPKESADHYEQRTWRNKLHVTKEGQCVVPAMAWKNGLRAIGAFLGEQIPGKGKATYAKHFTSGILVTDDSPLGLAAEDVQSMKHFVPADGKTGGSKRVWKYFPCIPQWETKVKVHILDDTITRPVFEHHFVELGRYMGIGTFRPQRGGVNGRFEVIKFIWQSDDE
jgi:hypothetical protein